MSGPLNDDDTNKTSEKVELTDKQRERIEKNRQKALLLKSARLRSHPYKGDNENSNVASSVAARGGRLVDSGAGFFIDPNEAEDEPLTSADLIEQPAPIIDGSEGDCVECKKKFSDSYLLKNFDVNVCDECRDWEKHKLITKTESKQIYCLKDCDFDVREPVLRFVIRKNPHNDRWGDMKLFYKQQVRERAMEVWGGEEKLEAEIERREENKDKAKHKKFEKRIKELRKAVRTSTWHKDLSKHEHEYDSENETYDEDEDVYTKKCKTCDHALTYEKM